MLIALTGLILRLLWLWVAAPDPVSDFWHYAQLGGGLLDDHQFGVPEPDVFRLPGYPAFLALAMLVSRGGFWLSLVNVFLSTGLILVLYEVARQLSRGNKRVAQLSALLCAIYPPFIFYSPVLASEHLFALLWLVGLVLLLSRTTGAAAAASGLILGLSILVRGEGFFYLPTYLLVVLFSKGRLRTRTMRGLLVVLCTALVLAPWYVRNLQLPGPNVGLSASAGLNFYFAHHRHFYTGATFTRWYETEDLMAPSIAEASRKGWKAGFEYLWRDPGHILRDMPQSFSEQYGLEMSLPSYLFWGSVKSSGPYGIISARAEIPGLDELTQLSRGSYGLLMLLAAASLLFWRSLPGTSWAILLSVPFGNWFCYCVVFLALSRYRFMVEVVAFVLAAVTLSGWARPFGRRPAAGADGWERQSPEPERPSVP